MDAALRQEIRTILKDGKDMTVATVREDGWPQATTVSYASDGEAIYFGCDAHSQKARNLARDDRVSLTVNLPYDKWDEIQGVSIGGRARRLTTPEDLDRAGAVFLEKFAPEIGQYLTGDASQMALFQVEPAVISVLDYRKGFGWHELVDMAKEPA
ncbi:pyridoxamine 5'-phosphate oxidase family protein [Phenylobacterium sp.]|uniref:pyridoxamine 5'-phosphate oxidase family protein n=1 Tax=Phenylobacterium sp. TaxID=1871053 RepID=UPI0035AE7A95